MRLNLALALVALFWAGTAAAATEADYAARRAALITAIEHDVRATSRYIGKSDLDPRVIEAMASTRRHEFVPEALRPDAYRNRPLPIGLGQTISQPYIVALMTDLLRLDANDVVFEVGTGSGYQAAILGALVKQVYTVEIVEPLSQAARERLARLGYDNVEVRHADGYYGWPEHAPFDAIVVTAVASHVPRPLLDQLKPGGRLVIPVGGRFLTQQLVLVEKDAAGALTTRQVIPVAFVPFTGGH